MRRHRVATAFAASLGLLAFELAEARAAPCVAVRAEARYVAYAYNHIVHLLNACDSARVCSVATNVNPKPQTIALGPGERVEVLTFRGSPAREFAPIVSCSPR